MANGGEPDAGLFIDKAIKLSEQLAATTPNDSTSQLMLARSYVLRMDTRPLPVEERFAVLQKALGLVDAIVQREPANTEALRSLGVIHQRIGDQSLRAAKVAGTGNSEATVLLKQAVKHHRLSGEAVAKLQQIDPKNNTDQRLVAIAENNLGEALLESGATRDGVLEIQKGLSYFAENARTDPANLNAKYEHALSLQTYIRALLKDGQVAEGKRQYAEVALLTEDLIKKDSQNREYINSAVTLREEAGDALLSLGNFSEALEQYRTAKVYLEKLIAMAPRSKAQHDARSDEKFGDYYAAMAERGKISVHKRHENWLEARKFYQSVLDLNPPITRRDEVAQKLAKCDKALAAKQ